MLLHPDQNVPTAHCDVLTFRGSLTSVVRVATAAASVLFIVAPSRQDGVGFESTLFTYTPRPRLDFCDPCSSRCLVKAAALLLSTFERSVQGVFPSIEIDIAQQPMRALCLLTMGIQHVNSPSPDIKRRLNIVYGGYVSPRVLSDP